LTTKLCRECWQLLAERKLPHASADPRLQTWQTPTCMNTWLDCSSPEDNQHDVTQPQFTLSILLHDRRHNIIQSFIYTKLRCIKTSCPIKQKKITKHRNDHLSN